MPKNLTIGNEEFEFPLSGENAGYGSEITDWAQAVTEALSTVQKPNDILTTSATIDNVVGTFNIPGFSFSTAEVISIDCKYFVKRITTAVTSVEVGKISGYFDGSNWGISIQTVGDANIQFGITPSGQVQYTIVSPLPGANHTGVIVFEAKVIND